MTEPNDSPHGPASLKSSRPRSNSSSRGSAMLCPPSATTNGSGSPNLLVHLPSIAFVKRGSAADDSIEWMIGINGVPLIPQFNRYDSNRMVWLPNGLTLKRLQLMDTFELPRNSTVSPMICVQRPLVLAPPE